MAFTSTPCRQFRRVVNVRFANPAPFPFPLAASSLSPPVSVWKALLQHTGSGDFPSPPRTPSPPLPHCHPSQTANWRRGSGVLPSPSTTPPSSPPSSPPPSPPRRARHLQAGNWRSSAAPPPPPPPPEWVVGRVVLLPFQCQVPTTSIVHKEASGSPWDHPQVITKIWEDNGIKLVKLRTCTSFHGVGIAHKREYHRHYFVEADKSQLTSESDAFSKQTYVNCSRESEFTIEHQYLQEYFGKAKDAIQFSPAALDSFNNNEPVRSDSFF